MREPCQYRVPKSSGKGCKHFEKRKSVGYCKLFRTNCTPWHLKHTPFHLSHSAVQTWSQCRYKFYLSQVLGYKPRKKSFPLMLGAYGHDYLNLLHSRYQSEEPDFGMMPELEARQALMLQALLRAYQEKANIVKGATEVPFFIKTVGKHPYVHGYVDLVYTDKRELHDGTTARVTQLWEHKFTSRPENYNLFALTEQLSTYWMAFPHVTEFIVNIIRIPSPALAKSVRRDRDYYQEVYTSISKRPKYFFLRERYYLSETNVAAAVMKYQQVWRELLLAVRYMDHGSFYQERNSCFSGFGQCDYYPICECTAEPLEPVVNDELFEQKQTDVSAKLDYLVTVSKDLDIT